MACQRLILFETSSSPNTLTGIIHRSVKSTTECLNASKLFFSAYEEHIKMHKRTGGKFVFRPKRCPYCTSSFRHEVNFQKHVLSHAMPDSKSTGNVTCLLCQEICHSKEGKKCPNHCAIEVGFLYPVYSSSFVKEGFRSFWNPCSFCFTALMKHVREKHAHLKDRKKCYQCGATFDSVRECKAHQVVHNRKVHKCILDGCGKTYNLFPGGFRLQNC